MKPSTKKQNNIIADAPVAKLPGLDERMLCYLYGSKMKRLPIFFQKIFSSQIQVTWFNSTSRISVPRALFPTFPPFYFNTRFLDNQPWKFKQKKHESF